MCLKTAKNRLEKPLLLQVCKCVVMFVFYREREKIKKGEISCKIIHFDTKIPFVSYISSYFHRINRQ